MLHEVVSSGEGEVVSNDEYGKGPGHSSEIYKLPLKRQERI